MNVQPQEIQRRLQDGDELFLLDVREPWEYAQAHIEGAILIPLNELPQRVAELPQDRPIVAICHLGSRSAMAASWLRQSGYAEVLNLQGGMEAWSRRGLPVQRGG